MPPGELTVICPGCGRQASLPFAAIKRDNSFCSACGKRLELQGAQAAPSDGTTPQVKAKKRPYRAGKRR